MKNSLFILVLLILCGFSVLAADPAGREQELLNQLRDSQLSETERIIIWYNLASVYAGYKPAEARFYAQKLIRHPDELAKQYGRISLASITLAEGQYDSTKVLLSEAGKQFRLHYSSDLKMGASIYNQLGHYYTVKSSPDAAIKNYLEALKLSEQTKDYGQMCAICTNISYLYGQVGAESSVKLGYAYRALNYAEKNKDPWAAEQAYSMLGNTLMDADSTEKALQFQMKGLELSRQLKSEKKECFAALNIGCNYLQCEKWNEAESYFKQALDLAVKNKLHRPEAYILSCLSDVYQGLKQYEQSEYFIQEALKRKDALSDSEQLDILRTAINLSVIRGNYASFEEQFEQYVSQAQKVHDLAVHEKMLELETQYNTEKKEHQITELVHNQHLILLIGICGMVALSAIVLALFFRIRFIDSQKKLAEKQVAHFEEQQKLVATKAVLDGETTERTRLARDLHDGLGGMLSAVKFNLYDVKKGALLGQPDVARFDKAIKMLDDSIQELRRVAHNMMPESLSRYGLKTALTDFCNYLPNVHFHYFGTESRLDSSFEIMLFRIVQELVNNAVKHSEAENIHVQVVQEYDRIAINVQDDGKGFDTEKETTGTGLKNIRQRVESFNGTIDIFSTPGSGTEISSEFKLPKEQK